MVDQVLESHELLLHLGQICGKECLLGGERQKISGRSCLVDSINHGHFFTCAPAHFSRFRICCGREATSMTRVTKSLRHFLRAGARNTQYHHLPMLPDIFIPRPLLYGKEGTVCCYGTVIRRDAGLYIG